MSRLFAMAIPVLQGQEQEWQNFAHDLKDTYYEEFQASRRKLGVRERAFLQQTPMGEMVIVTIEGEDPEKAFQDFAKGNDAFTKWFLENVKKLHGVDLSAPPPGPLPTMIVDSGPVMEAIAAV